MAENLDSRSLGQLFMELSREMTTLVRKEVELATTEITANIRNAGINAGTLVAGGALAHAGLLVLIAALVMGLSQMGVTPWLSALIVGLVTIGVGYVLARRALSNLRRTSVTPRNAIEEMKETAKWTIGQKA
jgi:Putative Actinobacterial Holin-X, holin superfamily III